MFDELSIAERLAALQTLDHYRKWHSLNDHRICARCGKMFTGFDLSLRRRPDDTYIASCPTPGCDSLPPHWLFYASDPESRDVTKITGEMDFASW